MPISGIDDFSNEEWQQGPFVLIVPLNLAVNTVKELDGATILLPTGTDLELAFADLARSERIVYEPVPVETPAEAFQQFLAGAGDALVVPRSAVSMNELAPDLLVINEPFGEGSSDAIVGTRRGNDLFGDGDDDIIDGRGGNDLIRGNGGDDDIDGGSGKDRLLGGRGNDSVKGGAGNDVMNGGSGRDTLSGGKGADRLGGGIGNDKLLGDRGNDFLVGGAGNDRLKGGGGSDTFVFSGLDDEGRDRILDFDQGTDTILVVGGQFSELSITAIGGSSTLIELDFGTRIVLNGVSASSVSADDFDFI